MLEKLLKKAESFIIKKVYLVKLSIGEMAERSKAVASKAIIPK
jgi:hypothetical protein